MAQSGTPWRQLPTEYGNSVYRRYARWRDQDVWPRRMAYRQADLELSAVWLDSTVMRAHVSAAGAPKHKDARPQPRRLQPLDPHPDGSPGPSPAPARDGRTAPRPHSGPDLGGSLDGRAAVLPDRRPDL